MYFDHQSMNQSIDRSMSESIDESIYSFTWWQIRQSSNPSHTTPVNCPSRMKLVAESRLIRIVHSLCSVPDDYLSNVVDEFGSGKKQIGLLFPLIDSDKFCDLARTQIVDLFESPNPRGWSREIRQIHVRRCLGCHACNIPIVNDRQIVLSL